MKFLIVFLCVTGLAFVAAAPVDEESGVQDAGNVAAGDRAAEDLSAEDRLVQANPQGSGIEERGMIPNARDIIKAIQDKYLTDDGKALVKAILPI